MKITWINHSCFQIHLAGKVIYTDPYEIPKDKTFEKADIILVSHNHHDHYDADSIKLIKKDSTKIVCPATCQEIIENEGAIGLSLFEITDIEDIKVQGVPAYNIERKRFHPKKNEWLGFIVDDGTTRVYHAGDTEVIPEMKDFKNIDLALIPVGGNQFTMDFAEGIQAVKSINPKMVIPMHDWGKDLNEFADLLKNEAPGIEVLILNHNEPKNV